MEVTCPKGHTSEITDPLDGGDGWSYEFSERLEPITVTLPNGDTTQIQHPVQTVVGRSLVWKCGAPDPSEDNPNRLCGMTSTIREDIASPLPLSDDDNS